MDSQQKNKVMDALDDLLEYMGDSEINSANWRNHYTADDRRAFRKKMREVQKLIDDLS